MKELTRMEARALIVREANRARVKLGRNATRYTMKDFQRCVFICRQRWLVHDSLLVAAGVNPVVASSATAT